MSWVSLSGLRPDYPWNPPSFVVRWWISWYLHSLRWSCYMVGVSKSQVGSPVQPPGSFTQGPQGSQVSAAFLLADVHRPMHVRWPAQPCDGTLSGVRVKKGKTLGLFYNLPLLSSPTHSRHSPTYAHDISVTWNALSTSSCPGKL